MRIFSPSGSMVLPVVILGTTLGASRTGVFVVPIDDAGTVRGEDLRDWETPLVLILVVIPPEDRV